MKNSAILIEEFRNTLLQIDRIKALEMFKQYFQEDNSFELLERIVIEALEQIGEGWENGTYSLAQVYMSGLICEELIEEYLPKTEIKRKDAPKMALAVLQDHHALGKKIVYSVLRAGGYDPIDLGYGLSPDQIVQKAIEHQVEILLISTLMLPSALKVKEVRKKLKDQGVPMKIIVGGAPFRLDSQLWEAVGADADGKNATDILRLIEKVVSA